MSHSVLTVSLPIDLSPCSPRVGFCLLGGPPTEPSMESPNVDLHCVLNNHECVYCDGEIVGKRRTLEQLRQGAGDQCPASQLWLACIDWAISNFNSIEYTDVKKTKMLEKNSMITERHSTETTLRFVVFQLQGKSTRQLLRGKS
jgi:hypothetical protein